MQRTFWFALVFALSAIGVFGASSPADKSFEDLAKRFIEDYLRTNPESATQLGDHRYDDFLTDYSPAAIEKWVGRLKDYQKELAAVDAKALTGPNRIDAQILATEIDSLIFALTEEKAFEWNPQSYSDSLANGVYIFVSREFGTPEQRLRSATLRLEAMRRVVEQIMGNLKVSPRIHMETAIQQTEGAINLVRTGFDPLLAQIPSLRTAQPPGGAPSLSMSFKGAQNKALMALERYRDWLKLKLTESDGDFRIGAERFRKKLRYALDSNLSPEEILARAERDLVTTTETMYATARPLYEKHFPGADAAKLADRPAVIRAVLNKLAEKAPTDDTIVDRAREITAAATAFTREKALVTVPDTPLKIIVLPEFQRGVAVAYCEPPGALEPNGETFFKVSPTPATWTAQRKASFFREYNDYMLHDLCIHEATPGHYLQLAHSNKFKAPTLVRAIWWSGTFVEGWAVYSERFMADAGFGGPEVRMQQLKMRLRMLINAILDNKVHTAGMTEKEAMALMMQQGFQEEGEAAGKWRRACQSSTQLSTYFVGAIEHDDLRAAAEAKAKREGKTFDLKAYHDRVLSYGSPPSKYVRAEMGL